MRANIIGTGIAGPMAAITLAENGYEVHAFDNRAAADLRSDGVLGITHAVWDILTAHGVTGAEIRQLPNGGDPDYHYLVWTDLHTSLIERAVELGVAVHYGETMTDDESAATADLTVHSTGISSARQVSHPRYSGYVIVRGLAYQFSGSAWTSLRSESSDGPWLFSAGDTRDGSSIEFFVPRKDVTLRTTYNSEPPVEAARLPLRWRRLVETVPTFQFAPMSDWEVPEHMVNESGVSPVIRIGDANGQLRPQTSMGANLAIVEGADFGLLVRRSVTAEVNRLAERQVQYGKGIEIGIYRNRELSKVIL